MTSDAQILARPAATGDGADPRRWLTLIILLLAAFMNLLDVSIVNMLPGQRRTLHLDTLLAAMADPILVLDAEGVIVVASAAAARVVGLNETAVSGIPLGELFGDSALQAISTIMRNAYIGSCCKVRS